MMIKLKNALTFLILPFILLHISGCAQVVTGTAVKVATVSQEERSIGEFVDDAIKRGASLIIIDCKGYQILEKNSKESQIPVLICDNVSEILTKMCFKFFPSLPSNLMAITGTNGKTSVVNFIQQLLELNDVSCLTIGTLGVKGAINISTNITTPTQVELYKILSNARELGTDYACIEASSHAIHQGRLAGLEFKSLFFSNLSQDHLDYHGDIERYFFAKLSITHSITIANAPEFEINFASSKIVFF